MSEYLDVSVLKGKTLTDITVSEAKDEILFHTTDGETYKMYHEQDCCEDVHIEDICGNIDSLIGEPLLVAEEVSGVDDGPLDDFDESYTWTFYKFATIKGSVTIRWYGTSNGYYSESVEFVKLKEAQNAEETPTDETEVWTSIRKYECPRCGSEFEVRSARNNEPCFCPFCGHSVLWPVNEEADTNA